MRERSLIPLINLFEIGEITMFTELTIDSTALMILGTSIVLCPALCWILAVRVRNAYR
jgi:hypothetical protein